MQPFDPEQGNEPTDPPPLTSSEQRELEAMLGGLEVREPSAGLDARVASVLAEPVEVEQPVGSAAAPATPAPLARLGPAVGLALAAAVALAAGLGIAFYPAGPDAPSNTATADIPAATPDAGPTTGPTSGPAVTPVAYNFNNPPVNLRWSRDYDRGTLTTDDGRRYRAYLRETIDQSTYIDPDTNASVQYTQPRQEWVIVPVAAY